MVPAVELERIVAALRELVPTWRGPPRSVEYLPGGYTNRNYRIEMAHGTYVLRLAERVANRHERRYLDAAAAPDVIAYDQTRGHLLTRWIDGDVLAEAPPTPAEAGAWLAQLHGEIPIGLQRYDFAEEVVRMFRVAERDGGLDGEVAATFQQLNWQPARWQGCHNDLNPWNIIRTQANADVSFRVLDWETAGDNDPLFDLAGLSLGLDWDLVQTTACLRTFERHATTRTAPARLRQTLCAYRIREYAWATAQIVTGNGRAEIREQAETMAAAVKAWTR